MADPRQWPGFRVPTADLPRLGVGTVRAAEGDRTYPQRAVGRDRQSVRRAKKALEQNATKNAAGQELSLAQIRNRKGLSRGDTSSLALQQQHVLATQIRLVPGGRRTILDLVQRAFRNQDPDAIKFWNVFMDLLPVHQQHVDLDAVCEAAGIAPDRLMAVVVSTAMRAGADAADLVAATMHPLIVGQTAKSAMRIGGQFATVAQRDREWMLQHNKFIPAPRGLGLTINANSNASAAAAASAKHQPSVPTFAESLQGAVAAHREVQAELIDGETIED